MEESIHYKENPSEVLQREVLLIKATNALDSNLKDYFCHIFLSTCSLQNKGNIWVSNGPLFSTLKN